MRRYPGILKQSQHNLHGHSFLRGVDVARRRVVRKRDGVVFKPDCKMIQSEIIDAGTPFPHEHGADVEPRVEARRRARRID